MINSWDSEFWWQYKAESLTAGSALNQNAAHRLMGLNTWSPAGAVVWGGLGCVSLLKEVWPRGLTLRI